MNDKIEKKLVEIDEELTQEEILMSEVDILSGILQCADLKSSDDAYSTLEIRVAGTSRRLVRSDDKPVPLEKGEKVMVRFKIRGLDQAEYTKCRENATRYVSNKKMGGIKMPTDVNQIQLYDALIYTATHPDDKAKIWDNKAAWKKLEVLTGSDMVSKLLYFGEKNAIVEIIDDKSGFNDDNISLEETSKK